MQKEITCSGDSLKGKDKSIGETDAKEQWNW